MRTAILTFSILLFLSGSLDLQADGTIEINQACAVNGGCFDGDTVGFPVTISQPGSYRLTGNLTLSSADDSGILISASNVTVDLNGFTIQGVTVCTGEPVTSCEPVAQSFLNFGIGVGGNFSPRPTNLTVRNGTIRGMGDSGVRLGLAARVIDVRSIGNAQEGVSVHGGSIVRGCTIFRNGNSGIIVNRIVDDPENQLTIIQDNVSSGNQDRGIAISNIHALITGNTVSNNGSFGISISAGSASGYSNNVVLGNVGGTISGGTEMGVNLCNGSTTCP